LQEISMDMPTVTPFSSANADAARALTGQIAAQPPGVTASTAQIDVKPGSLAGGRWARDQPLALAPKSQATYGVSAAAFASPKGHGTQLVISAERPLGVSDGTFVLDARLRDRNGGDDRVTDFRVGAGVEIPVAPWLTADGRADIQFSLADKGVPSSGTAATLSGGLAAKQPLGSNMEVTGRVGIEYTVAEGKVTDKLVAELGGTQQVSDSVRFFGKASGETGDPGSNITASVGAEIDVSDDSSIQLTGTKLLYGDESALPRPGGGDDVAFTFKHELN
jgi:hypothetical protein